MVVYSTVHRVGATTSKAPARLAASPPRERPLSVPPDAGWPTGGGGTERNGLWRRPTHVTRSLTVVSRHSALFATPGRNPRRGRNRIPRVVDIPLCQVWSTIDTRGETIPRVIAAWHQHHHRHPSGPWASSSRMTAFGPRTTGEPTPGRCGPLDYRRCDSVEAPPTPGRHRGRSSGSPGCST